MSDDTADDLEIPIRDKEPLTLDRLAERLDEAERNQKAAHKHTFKESAWVSVGVGLCAVFVTLLTLELWPQPGPTTTDDSLASLLRPGPHCYNSPAEMAAARQRALAATDRMSWEQDFERQWRAERDAPAENYSMVPLNPMPLPEPDPIPEIVGPSDPGVPPSADPYLAVDEKVCFGITDLPR